MANFIWKNRHGRYYFRVRIPALYRSYFNNKAELRSPLQTSDRRTAKRMARAYMAALDSFLNGLDEMTNGKKQTEDLLSLNYEITIDTVDLPDGRKKTTKKIDITPEETRELGGPQALADLIHGLKQEQTSSQSTPKIDTVGNRSKDINASNHPTISEAIDRFLQYKLPKWKSPKTQAQYKGTLNLLRDHFGQRRLDQVTKVEAVEFFSLIEKLPPNINHVHSKFKGLTLSAIASKNDGKRIEAKTFNDHLIRVKALYNWTARLSETPLSNPFEAVEPKNKKSMKRGQPFSEECIAKIFSSYIHSAATPWPARKKSNEPSKYWMPLLLAYTGCRINEIAQLYLSDFTEEDAQLILNIRGEQPDQRTKTDTERRVPVHPFIVKLGFRGYLADLKVAGHTRLFPELKYSDNGDGYSRTIGDFLNKHYKDVGALGTNHSFRHLVIKTLSQADVQKEVIRSIVGHYDPNSPEDVTDRYGGSDKFSIDQKLKAMKSIKYKVENNIINFKAFQSRAGKYRY